MSSPSPTTSAKRSGRHHSEKRSTTCPSSARKAWRTTPTCSTTCAGDCWLVDPLDGTKNFAKGWTGYVVMVARIADGLPVASWIWIPQRDQMAIAVAGAGATINDEPARIHPATPIRRRGRRSSALGTCPRPIAHLSSDFESTWATQSAAWAVRASSTSTSSTATSICCSTGGPIRGITPGSLFAIEAGANALRPDGSRYRPDDDQLGLLVTRDCGRCGGRLSFDPGSLTERSGPSTGSPISVARLDDTAMTTSPQTTT